MKRYMPVFVDVGDKKILVVGGGRVAHHKISKILLFSQNITVVAKEISSEMKQLDVTLIEREFDEKDLDGVFLVYACTNDTEINRTIKEKANKRNILVNVADNSELCDFISPAVTIHNGITVAVSSGGADVKKAIKVRDGIEEFLKYGGIDEDRSLF